jgi:AraC-like DNA-binding protein
MEDAFRWDPLNTTRHAYYHFRIRRRPEDFPPEQDWPRQLLLPRGDILRPLWRHMAALQEANRPGLQGLFENAARQMLAAFVSGMVHSLGEGRVALPEPIEAVLRHLQQSWQGGRLEPPTLERLARVAAVSPGHLCRLFKQAYGRGPMEVLRKVRLDRAATMLSHTNLQIQEIARLTGFENAFHFSRCFRTEFGASPRAFRIGMAAGKFTPGSRFHQRHQMTSRLWGEL